MGWHKVTTQLNQHLLRYSCLPETRASCVGTLIPLYIRTRTLRVYNLCVPIGLLVDAVIAQLSFDELDKLLGGQSNINIYAVRSTGEARRREVRSIAGSTSSFSWMDAWLGHPHLRLHSHLQGSTPVKPCLPCPPSVPLRSLASAYQNKSISALRPIRAYSRLNAPCHATSSRRSLPVSPPAQLPSRSFPARCYTGVEVPVANDS